MKKIFFCALTASWLFASAHASAEQTFAALQQLNFIEKIETLNQLIQTTGQRTLSKEDQETCASFLMGLFHEVALHGQQERIAFKKLLHSLIESTLLTHEQREYVTKLMLPFVDSTSQAPAPTIQRSPATEAENTHANNHVFHEPEPLNIPVIKKEWITGTDGKLEQKTEITFRTITPQTKASTQQKNVTLAEKETKCIEEENISRSRARRPHNKIAGIRRST
ncbi:hypothetical protein K2X40_03630 [Candidatus Babeliales bacterium]|nr:hypothetical protein [Candidatus Babeliales bacterium]